MNPLLVANWVLFLAVTVYGLYLFTRVIRTRVAYIRLGKKFEYDNKLKERLKRFGFMCSARKSC